MKLKQARAVMEAYVGPYIAVYRGKTDVLAFKDRQEMLDWMRSGVHYDAYSLKTRGNVRVRWTESL
jgi:hypothetical protein